VECVVRRDVACCMLHVMVNIEACCIFYVKVGTFTHLEQSKISLLTVNTSRIVTLTVQLDMVDTVIFRQYPQDELRQTSADILSLELDPIHIVQLGDSGGRTLQLNSVHKQQHQTDLLQVVRQWETLATCSHTQ